MTKPVPVVCHCTLPMINPRACETCSIYLTQQNMEDRPNEKDTKDLKDSAVPDATLTINDNTC